MVRLISYECKKHFFKKTILVALLVFSLINVAKIYSVYNTESLLAEPLGGTVTWKQAYAQIFKDFGGEMTVDKINSLLAVYRPLDKKVSDRTATTAFDVPGTYTGNLYSDYNLLSWYFVQPMEYSYMYQNTAKEIVATATENAAFYTAHGNEYEARKNAAIADMFDGRKIDGLYYTEMYQSLVKYDFSILLVLLLCIYALSSVFTVEKETDMELLLITSRAGSFQTIFAKIISSVLFVVLVSIWFSILDYVTFSLAYPSFGEVTTPLYALRDYSGTPLDISLGAYVVVASLFKTIGVVSLCMCFLFLANLFKNALLPFIFSFLSFLGLLACFEMFAGSSQMLIKTVNPFALIVNHELFHKTEFVNLFGMPVPSFMFALVIGVLWILSFGVLILLTSRTNTVTRRKKICG